MLSSRKHFSSVKEVLKFTYPKLHKGKSWYVDSISKITERRKRASELVGNS